MSESSPVCPNEWTSIGCATTSLMGQNLTLDHRRFHTRRFRQYLLGFDKF